ncbi:MAG: sterol desaturase family protein [Candidatus Wallbacteria bacterium]|nr:sterol desaturase family protein [Candidatus Wallbacteria bacterium]
MGRLRVGLDYAILPLFLACALGGTYALLAAKLPSTAVIGLVMGSLAALAAILERVRPQRHDYVALDQPLPTELAHYLFNYNLGYVLAIVPITLLDTELGRRMAPSLWPSSSPLAVQIALAGVLGEMLSYWQHRLVHRIPWFWRFHSLHHSGSRMNVARGARFHFVDIAPALFFVLFPLVLLRAPEEILTWTATLCGSLGVIEHSNIRLVTPQWLDRILCTPAVHRYHHSRDRAESDGNFGTAVMLFDHLFGTYVQPSGAGPAEVGIAQDTTRPGFAAQMLDPFYSGLALLNSRPRWFPRAPSKSTKACTRSAWPEDLPGSCRSAEEAGRTFVSADEVVQVGACAESSVAPAERTA